MDGISDEEAEGIFDRLKTYVDFSKVKSKNKEDLIKELEDKIKGSVKPADKSGSTETLLRAGFPARAVKDQKILDQLGFKEKEFVAVKKEKIKIRVKGRFRYYNAENIRVTESFWRGMPARYYSSVRTGKRITWGLVK